MRVTNMVKQYAETTGPDGTLYALVGLDQAGAQQIAETAKGIS